MDFFFFFLLPPKVYFLWLELQAFRLGSECPASSTLTRGVSRETRCLARRPPLPPQQALSPSPGLAAATGRPRGSGVA